MDFDTYENEVVARTGKMEEGVEAAKALGALGLCGEAAEVYQLSDLMSVSAEQLTKELGDVLWYICYTGRAYGFTLQSIHEFGTRILVAKALDELVCACGNVADVVKKELFHAKPATYEQIKWLLAKALRSLCAYAKQQGIAIEQVMLTNQRKLLARFPNGWSKADATAKADEASK